MKHKMGNVYTYIVLYNIQDGQRRQLVLSNINRYRYAISRLVRLKRGRGRTTGSKSGPAHAQCNSFPFRFKYSCNVCKSGD